MARAIAFLSQLEPDRNLVQKPSDWCCGRPVRVSGQWKALPRPRKRA